MDQVVISYIPALHQGYLKFFNKYPGQLYVLGNKFVLQHPRMERDIRAMDVNTVAAMVRSTKLMQDVQVLGDESDLETVLDAQIIMPDEDVNRTFAQKYLKNAQITFIPIFLRWDRQISTTEFEVPPHRIITTKDRDRELMGLANIEASRSADWWRQIGAVVSRDGKPLLIGHNKPLLAEDYTVNVFGDPRSNFDYGEYIEMVKTIHAESGVIAEAAKRGIPLEGSSIYVSTFPCPVCAKLIAASGIRKVYYDKGYSMLDAEDILKAHRVELVLVK